MNPLRDDMIDHERLILDRFRCPQCGMSLELVELRPYRGAPRDPDHIELIACCRRCEIGMTEAEWRKRRVA